MSTTELLGMSELRLAWGAAFGVVFVLGYAWMWRYADSVKAQGRRDSKSERPGDQGASSEDKPK